MCPMIAELGGGTGPVEVWVLEALPLGSQRDWRDECGFRDRGDCEFDKVGSLGRSKPLRYDVGRHLVEQGCEERYRGHHALGG